MSKRGPKLQIPTNCNPLVKWLCEEINRQDRSLGEVALKAGLGRNTISEWRTRGRPSLPAFEAVANALGYEIEVRPATSVSAARRKEKHAELSPLY
jgi:DNA-binding phage protein